MKVSVVSQERKQKIEKTKYTKKEKESTISNQAQSQDHLPWMEVQGFIYQAKDVDSDEHNVMWQI